MNAAAGSEWPPEVTIGGRNALAGPLRNVRRLAAGVFKASSAIRR
jgi:hypothetical protein